MTDAGVSHICFTCETGFVYDPDKVNTHIPRYEITVCQSCWRSNWDGWRPDYSDKIETHMKAKGLDPVTRNAKDLLPRS